MNDIGKRLRKFRELKNKSVNDISGQIGVPASTYREWEYGRSIRGDHYIPLALALGVPLVELLTGEKATYEQVVVELQSIEQQLRIIIDTLILIEK